MNGLEPLTCGLRTSGSDATVRANSASAGDPKEGADAREPSRTQAVASLATALACAVLAGDYERARALAAQVRALTTVEANIGCDLYRGQGT